MWRNDHDGAKTLCNACGVKQQRANNRAKALAAQAGASRPLGSPLASRPISADLSSPLTPEKLTRAASARGSDRGFGPIGKRRSAEHLGQPYQPPLGPPPSHAEHKRSCSGHATSHDPDPSETSSWRQSTGRGGQAAQCKTVASMQHLELHMGPPHTALLSEITAALVASGTPTDGCVTLAILQGRQARPHLCVQQAQVINPLWHSQRPRSTAAGGF